MTEEATGEQQAAPGARPSSAPEIEREIQNPENVVLKAEQAAERLEQANDKFAQLLQRQEALMVEKTLGGEAAVQPTQKTETEAEYAARVLRGEMDVK